MKEGTPIKSKRQPGPRLLDPLATKKILRQLSYISYRIMPFNIFPFNSEVVSGPSR